MNNPFIKTDLARLVELPLPARVLGLLAALRFITADDLVLMNIKADDINTLVDAGLVFRFRLQRRLTQENPTEVLALRRDGRHELARLLDVDSDSIPYSTRSSCDRSAMFMDHHLAVSRFGLLLAQALVREGTPARLLSWETDPDRLADSAHVFNDPCLLGRQPLVADALAVVQGPNSVEGMLVEIDRGTERPGYMARKYAGYLSWWRDGGPARRFDVRALRLLTVAPDRRRTERLREAAKETTHGHAAGLFWFAAEDDLLREGFLAPVWSTLRADHLPLWS